MEDRVKLSREEVDKMLEDGERVHTYKQAGPALIGCDWERDKILELVEKNGAELAGDVATNMNHGVVVYDGDVPMFCATA